jgi:hypothetical protein
MRKSVKSASQIITGITGFWNSAQQLYINNLLIIIDRIIFISGYNLMKYVFVQSVLPQEDVIALKKKTKQSQAVINQRSPCKGSLLLSKGGCA